MTAAVQMPCPTSWAIARFSCGAPPTMGALDGVGARAGGGSTQSVVGAGSGGGVVRGGRRERGLRGGRRRERGGRGVRIQQWGTAGCAACRAQRSTRRVEVLRWRICRAVISRSLFGFPRCDRCQPTSGRVPIEQRLSRWCDKRAKEVQKQGLRHWTARRGPKRRAAKQLPDGCCFCLVGREDRPASRNQCARARLQFALRLPMSNWIASRLGRPRDAGRVLKTGGYRSLAGAGAFFAWDAVPEEPRCLHTSPLACCRSLDFTV